MLIGDEEILATRIAAQRAQRHSILNEVTIDNQVYQFEQQEISFPSAPDCSFSIVLPENLHPLPPERAKIKYQSENRPEVILSDDDAALNFTFQCQPEPSEDLDTRLAISQDILKRINPGDVFFSENVRELENGLKIASFDFSGTALDDMVYSLYFFTDLPTEKQTGIIGIFTCPLSVRDKWEPLFRQMIETISPIQ